MIVHLKMIGPINWTLVKVYGMVGAYCVLDLCFIFNVIPMGRS